MKNLSSTIDRALPMTSDARASAMLWMLGFAVLTAIGAKVTIPIGPVPLTLQTPCVLLAGAFLGARKGAISQVLYLATGAAGLPVFAFGGGALYLFGPTGGYLLAFPIAAFAVGWSLRRAGVDAESSRWRYLITTTSAMVIGMAIIFTLGVIQLKAVSGESWQDVITLGFVRLQLWDALKLALTVTIFLTLTGWIRRSPISPE